jgi:hypothetical protein
MAGEMLCPDCGGVVGATETTDVGPPCTCFSSSSSDTAVDMPSPADQVAPAGSKICVVCGKDVTGHRRLKDSRGYICYSCAKEEQRRERGGRVRCKGCGKLVLPAALNDYAGIMLCNECFAERKRVQKQEIKRIGIGHVQTSHERKRLYMMLGFAGFLLLIIILNKLNLLPHFF